MSRTTTLVLSAVGALVLAGVLVFGVLRLASDPEVARSVGVETFEVGDAKRLAEAIETSGPLLFQDPLSQGGDEDGRDIWVLHEGGDPEEGWSAVEARSRETGCSLDWDRRRKEFRRPCPGNHRYPAEVEDGVVVVDLRAKA